jgi:hypothetical protein
MVPRAADQIVPTLLPSQSHTKIEKDGRQTGRTFRKRAVPPWRTFGQ